MKSLYLNFYWQSKCSQITSVYGTGIVQKLGDRGLKLAVWAKVYIRENNLSRFGSDWIDPAQRCIIGGRGGWRPETGCEGSAAEGEAGRRGQQKKAGRGSGRVSSAESHAGTGAATCGSALSSHEGAEDEQFLIFRGWCEAVLRSRGAEIKLSPGAGAGVEITYCGSGSNSGSFLFIKNLKKFYRKKIMVAKEFFVNYHNFNPIWVHHASVYVKKVLIFKSKKANWQGFL